MRDHWHAVLAPLEQVHLLRDWDRLDEAGRAELSRELAGLDWDEIAELSRVARTAAENPQVAEQVNRSQPPRHLVRLADPHLAHSRQNIRRIGQDLLRAGRVAVLVVAGGQGTRLGFPRPKGLYPIAPVTGKSLFALFADQLRGLESRYGHAVPWLIMTSSATHAETVAAFEEVDYFGLPREQVRFFEQGTMPAFDRQSGRILMSSPSQLSLNPDGHGGMVGALARSGLLAELRERGIDVLYYHQIDNPLAILCDPVFLGLHAQYEAEVSTKVVSKTSPAEKVGVVVDIDGQTQIVEYSDLPVELATQRDADGGLRFWAGNMAIHVFQREFLEQLATGPHKLPWHRAVKKVPFWNAAGVVEQPAAENGIKFERFIFDALPLARTALVVEADRSEEFAPLKNASGEFSAEDVRACMTRRARSWLSIAGQTDPGAGPVEIDADAALDRDDFRERVANVTVVPTNGGWHVRIRR